MQQPKVELHRHLTGSLRVATIWETAQRQRVQLGFDTPAQLSEALRRRTPAKNLREFITSAWGILQRLHFDAEVTTRAVLEAAADAYTREGVVYLELRVSPKVSSETHDFRPFLMALASGVRQAENHFPITVRIILSVPRHVVGRLNTCDRQQYFARLLSACQDHRQSVVGFDLTGIEDGYPSDPFRLFFREAARNGYGITIHAGETGDRRNIIKAVDDLGATRVGHALAAAGDGRLLNYLRDRQILLEVSPSSNVLTGSIASYSAHPIRQFLSHSIAVAVCADNPGISDIDLSKEYRCLAEQHSLTRCQLHQMNLDAVRFSFADELTRQRVVERLSDAPDYC